MTKRFFQEQVGAKRKLLWSLVRTFSRSDIHAELSVREISTEKSRAGIMS